MPAPPRAPASPRVAAPTAGGRAARPLHAGDGATCLLPAIRPRRIALFTGNYHHIPDGVSLTLNRLVRHLEARGDRVLVFGPTVDEPPMEHAGTLVPVPSVPMPGRPEYQISYRFPKDVQERVEAFRPDLVHIATPDWLGFRALQWARRSGVPVVTSYHTHFPSYLGYYHLGAFEGALWAYTRWFYNRCAQVYVPSWPMADELRRHGVRAPLKLWARGVELDRFGPEQRSAAWREAQGYTPDEVVVAFVSRLVVEKGLDVYADVVSGMQARGLKARALVVGEGPAREMVREKLPRAVFTGHLDGDELATAYASADVFLFPSETETFGNVTLEALASGLPVVAADAAGSRMLVDDGVTGRLCPPRDTDAFLAATAELVSDPALRARMGAAAREAARAYAWPAVLDRIVGYYGEVLDPARPAAGALEHPATARAR
jgi:phosphatidylinositol alpha 1,6-mannosyltransferase